MLKRTFDFCCSFLGLILLFPLFVILLFLIKLEDPDLPVFFKQVRVGRGGEVFTMYKFRSMRQNPDFAHTFVTTADDPRITKIGVLIRRWKLDELPELYNVVIGDMSLVGPRPDVQEYADLLTGKYKCILYLRPGITGPASLKYSNEEYLLSTVKNPEEYNRTVIFPDKMRINLEYYENHSMKRDILIIFKTIFGNRKK